MNATIVFSFIGVDKPGLVEKLSSTVSAHGGNWLESRMSQLAGNFAGIARVQIAASKTDELINALTALSDIQLDVTIQTDHSSNDNIEYTVVNLSLIGNDRPGIVRELASALAARNINVCEMETAVISAAMTADPLFEATAEIQVPASLDLVELTEKLDEIANDLDIDINLEM